MPKKPEPKRKLDGGLERTTISPGPGKDSYPLGRNMSYEMQGYHTKPTGGKAVEKEKWQRKTSY